MPSTQRITGGQARGVPLAPVRGARLRPTSAQVREAVFNILGDQVAGARVADLYAGSGALGIEALSRGAARVVFVERQRAACQAIVQNLARTGFADMGEVVRGALPRALATLAPEARFDIVLLDPPYADEETADTLLAAIDRLDPGGVVVYEHSSRYNPPERLGGLTARRRTYGDTAVTIYLEEGA